MFKFFAFAFLGLSFIFSFYNFYYSGRILPRIFVASINVSGLHKEDAAMKISSSFDYFATNGIKLLVEGKEEVIDPKNIELKLQDASLLNEAWRLGREGKWHEQFINRISAPFSLKVIHGRVEVNEQKLTSELSLLASAYNVARRDVRFDIEGQKVNILYDTKPGKALNVEKARRIIVNHIAQLDLSPIQISLEDDMPRAANVSGEEAKQKAEKIIAETLVLSYKNFRFTLLPQEIGSWIISKYDEDKLIPDFNTQLISKYAISIAEKVDIPSQNPTVKVESGKVVEFVPPKQGRALSQNETIELIASSLLNRASGKEVVKELSLPVAVKKPIGEGSSADLGIVELIGKATTPFSGSPQNRIHNIKNGVRFLTGILVPPGAVLSTVESLGKIDNTAGYLPELVIKGDETTPEFGGGLCQVSTTLFRAVLNAGLPVIERRNHSYRVPYYERDGEGNFIGPGLDATIYDPLPDFKFKNDTSAHILIQGYVEGDKATFEIYGTNDGRKSFIDGPRLLEEIPAGEPIYIETANLPMGEKKKIDTAHPGGTAVATYKIEYHDGRVEEQEFKSYYRRWSDKWLIGTATSTAVN